MAEKRSITKLDLIDDFLFRETMGDLELLFRYIMDSRKENALDDTTKQLHQIVELLRHNSELGVGYMNWAYEMEWERQEGQKEGREEERLEFARSLLSTDMPIEEIAVHTRLSREALEALRLQFLSEAGNAGS